ncbi:universal stress protein [Laspinema olomoucense]|uniref:Universal stress protein n=1 Tax=Laspinema olomoucense D3b TaxID=2953688 RepID=A0ABT2N449_9CYAN|nr:MULTISPECIES: universal stress protein [unclassified Laspinema]MCT7973361.1 universal stress protein [Laspinema sp. D3d]MCT7977251.1 universal stress protein [Laspinema sp. D3b]MCT7989900.1 universal stress protein [Laspinema sp. D3a]MCT7995540.1 universal stress protein [Laspinema sp. D3c]
MISTILVALDGSDLSEQVIATLHNLKLETMTQVILAHVMSKPTSDLDVLADRPQVETEDIPYRAIEKKLQSYQEKIPCKTELEIVTGDPSEEIVRLANIYQADLILIGSRGLTGMKRILQGSVSSQVVTDASCSVLVVKPVLPAQGK